MKKIIKSLAALSLAAAAFASCAPEGIAPDLDIKKTVKVYFGAESSIEGATKATLTTEDELTFKSAWENGDSLSVYYHYYYDNDNDNGSGNVSATWKDSYFETDLPEYNARWIYNVVYPAPDADSLVDFGSNRVQNGDDYNGRYDLMKGSAIAENAAAGKTEKGENIVFKMDRQTGIVYFHLKSALSEDVVSATLSVDEPIACSMVMVDNEPENGFDLGVNDLKKITITFPEKSPKSTDFKLWFNVLPTAYTSMTLTVETIGHTLTMTRKFNDEFVAGKLYKTVKEIPADKWVEKTPETPPTTYTFEKVTDASTLAVGDKLIIVASGKGKAAGAISDDFMVAVEVTIADDGTIAESTLDSGVVVLTLGGSEDAWTLANAEGKLLGASEEKKVAFGSGTTTWAISIDEFSATIQNTENGCGHLQYNSSHPRFTTYSSTQTAPELYRLESSKTAIDTPANLSVSAEKVVSWDAVNGAASYKVTIGTKVYQTETNSYNASEIDDEYYDVAVVAIPADKDNFKNSAAAKLTAAKFGTPTLTAPMLSEGAVDETSIRVNWTSDKRAVNGYQCEIFDGTALKESKVIKVNYVVFSNLADGKKYTIKVNAIAVEGDKPYAVSAISEIAISTKPAQYVSDVTVAGNYTIKGLTVYAVPNASNAIVSDGTGFILLYKSSHGLKVGNTCDVAGNVKMYNGVLEFSSPSITNKGEGEAPMMPEAVEADEDYLASYVKKPVIAYVHAKGTQAEQNILVGKYTFLLSADNKATDNNPVEVYGFVYGYNTSVYFVATSIEVDHTFPTLSVDQTSKTWASEGVEPFVIKVTVNSEGGDWTVSPNALDWATVELDKSAGTITVTPKAANTTDAAYEATLVVSHTGNADLTKNITLKQKGGGEPKTYTLLFGEEYNSKKEDDYSNSWSATNEGFTCSLKNWNNHNNAWSYIRAGSKQKASVATIETNEALPEAIATVTMVIDEVTSTYINSIILEVISNEEVKETISASSIKKGDCEFNISEPTKDCKYKISVDCKIGKNGIIQVSKVTYSN